MAWVVIYIFLPVDADPTLRHALLDTQDLLPDEDNSLFLNTNDQFDAESFAQLEPPLSEEDYMFSLEQNEGISDLFDIDTCNLSL